MGNRANSSSDILRKEELRSRGTEFARHISWEIHRRDITKSQVCDKLGLTYNGLSRKLKGKSPFTMAEIECLADWWNLTIDEAVGRCSASSNSREEADPND